MLRPQPRDKFELFQSHFDQLLNPKHELIQLANQIDWLNLDAAFVDTYCTHDGLLMGTRGSVLLKRLNNVIRNRFDIVT